MGPLSKTAYRLPVRLLPGHSLWFVAFIIWLVWAPFAVSSDVPTFARVSGFASVPQEPHVILGNLLLFAPLAVLAVLVSRGRRPWLIATVTALCGSLAVEVGQTFLGGRTVSPYDVLLNTGGAGLLGFSVQKVVLNGVSRAVVLRATAAGVAGATVVMMLLSHAQVTREFRLTGWNSGYELVAQDESDGSRPYRGAIHEAWICTARGPHAGEGIVPAGAIAEGEGLPCGDLERVRSERSELSDAAMREQRIRLSARVEPWVEEQTGPARIITFSQGVASRNVTLAQEGRALVFRVRTDLTGPNGSNFQFFLPGAFHGLDEVEVYAHFDRGEVALRSSVAPSASWRFQPGLLDAWIFDRSLGILEPSHTTRAMWVGIVVLLFPLGLLLALQMPQEPRFRRAGFAVGVMLAPALVLWVLVFVPLSVLQASFVFGIAAAGWLLGRVDAEMVGQWSMDATRGAT